MKTVVRIPGPSWVAKRMVLNMVPESERSSASGIHAVVFDTQPAGCDVIDRDLPQTEKRAKVSGFIPSETNAGETFGRDRRD